MCSWQTMALRSFSLGCCPVFRPGLQYRCIILNKKYSSGQGTNNNKSGTNSEEYDSPLDLYNARLQSGELHQDAYQEKIVTQLQDLNDQLKNYKPTPYVPPRPPGIFNKLLGFGKAIAGENEKVTKSPLGFYMYGSVGCGKTMLMDMFHQTCPIEQKHRIHFHAFMLDVHKRIHAAKLNVPRQYNVAKGTPFDPIPPLAREIAQTSWLLCFDEFQVTDIADAMILKRLFSYLWRNGVVVIATSNRKPDDLYNRGLQRINFLPFIPLLKDHCKVINLDSGIDYRRMTMPSEGKVFFLLSDDADWNMDSIYDNLSSEQKAQEGPKTLTVLGRKVLLPKTCGRILDTTFKELCMKPLGAADYLEISKEFDCVILRGIPHMDMERRTEARRFITLIDTLYDNMVRLVCSAEVPIDNLFAMSNKVSDYDKHFARVLIGDLDIQKGDENEIASIFTGEEEKFAVERVMSRLIEMQSEEYWDLRDEFVKTMKRKTKKKRSKGSKKEPNL